MRRAAELAAWDIGQLLDALGRTQSVRFVTARDELDDDERNQLRQWLVIAALYESAEGREECLLLDEQIAPIVRAMRERAAREAA